MFVVQFVKVVIFPFSGPVFCNHLEKTIRNVQNPPGTHKIGKCILSPHLFTHPVFSQTCFGRLHRFPQLTLALSTLHPCRGHVVFLKAAPDTPRETTGLVSTLDGVYYSVCIYSINYTPTSYDHVNKKAMWIFFFLCPHLQHMEVSGLGVEWELQLPAMPRPQQCGNEAVSATSTTACSNARSFIH